MKEFNLICAVSLNGVIGDTLTNSIPWYAPQDLKHFKKVTSDNTVVMGSKTFASIGKLLPNRRNVVITRSAEAAQALKDKGVDDVYHSFSHVMKYEKPGFFVIGGEHIFQEAIKALPTKMYLTIVNEEIEGDVRFPITGRTLKGDYFNTLNGIRYTCEFRSDWINDNGYELQFTEFVMRAPGSY